MTDLIESVARAIAASTGKDPGEILDPPRRWAPEPFPRWWLYRDFACAAILATLEGLKEPSEAERELMRGLIRNARVPTGRGGWQSARSVSVQELTELRQAMLTAAKEEIAE